jgi:hypothetical protein
LAGLGAGAESPAKIFSLGSGNGQEELNFCKPHAQLHSS